MVPLLWSWDAEKHRDVACTMVPEGFVLPSCDCILLPGKGSSTENQEMKSFDRKGIGLARWRCIQAKKNGHGAGKRVRSGHAHTIRENGTKSGSQDTHAPRSTHQNMPDHKKHL
eukprot:TRINITY_DN59119_c0_g1_i1.p2 TRINITY_DN59119_c0_g1~~TRINITY_DN59119_c0_g1_i1.p2  ORF type:complete len:114 (-),score=6.42 TRINITY_DN59119_c0_g1_i1:333-674(-)